MTTSTAAAAAPLLLLLLLLAPSRLPSVASFASSPPPTRTRREVRSAAAAAFLGRPSPRMPPLRASSSSPINGDEGAEKKEEEEEEAERDLFEYFDPRLSPHEYPDGIRDDASTIFVPTDGGDDEAEEEDDDDGRDPLRLSLNPDYTSSFDRRRRTTTEDESAVERARDDERPEAEDEGEEGGAGGGGGARDLFDVFDPRLSPHEYPDGIPDCSSSSSSSSPSESDREVTYAAFSSTTTTTRVRSSSSSSRTTTEVVEEEERVGVLLIDHGSKRESANENLRSLAKAYDARSPSHYVVRAAHMEICRPSVEDGLRVLLEEERVDKIVCHPYFLSPGKHATEDVPALVAEAIEKLDRPDVPVVTTRPVGSNVDVMIDAIESVVDRTLLDFMEEEKEGGKGGGGGGKFLGDDERL